MKKQIIKLDELEQCACFNIKLMARELTNQYNKSLKLNGINSSQIPILAILNIYEKLETSKISKILSLEISSTRRSLAILIKNELIKIVNKGIDGNLLTLTNKGYKKLGETLPIWRKLHRQNKNKVKKYIKILEKIAS